MLQNISFVDSPKNVPLNGSEASDITCKFPVPVDQNFHFRFLKSVSSNLLDCASPLLECGSTRLLFFRGYAVAVSLGPEI